MFVLCAEGASCSLAGARIDVSMRMNDACELTRKDPPLRDFLLGLRRNYRTLALLLPLDPAKVMASGSSLKSAALRARAILLPESEVPPWLQAFERFELDAL